VTDAVTQRFGIIVADFTSSRPLLHRVRVERGHIRRILAFGAGAFHIGNPEDVVGQHRVAIFVHHCNRGLATWNHRADASLAVDGQGRVLPAQVRALLRG
jgi:hypothetical protein